MTKTANRRPRAIRTAFERGMPPAARGVLPTLAAVLVLALAACGRGGSESSAGGPGAGATPDVPVTVATARTRDVPLEITAVGTVQPTTTVDVLAQVGGTLTRVAFRDGQDVRKGDLLFTIDPRPFQAALQQAEAALERDVVNAKQLASEVVRYQDLVTKDYVTQEQFDRTRSEAAAAEAVVAADRAAVEKARLDLSYATIHAPMDARAGEVKVHEGNVVKENDTKLVTLNRIAPIEVAFSIPQQRLDEIRRRRAEARLQVVAGPPNAKTRSEGELTFLDNAVDPKTGTILLKATFPNEDRSLWPGEFVEARLRLEMREGALTVPSEAVQTGQQGLYVWFVKPDRTAEPRPVVTAGTNEADTVITEGLAAGDIVVTDGQLRLMPGVRVAAKGGDATSAAPSASAPAPQAPPADGASDASGATR